MNKRTIIGIFGRLLRQKRKKRTSQKKPSRVRYLKHKEQARLLVHEQLIELNRHYGFTYGQVSIRDQKTRWGSCSSKKNLNFNYKIVFLPPHLVDYIIVHELCHLEEFNHGKQFWDLVARTIPHHESCRNELRVYEKTMHLRDHASMLP
jgi:predicted metal-dependent hydrolase